MKQSKRMQEIKKMITPGKVYTPNEAINVFQSLPKPKKLKETVECAINLGIDARKSEQSVRGSVVLPKGTGRKIRIAVFTSVANHDAANNAGADLVGLDDLADKVKAGNIDFDILLATPDAMRVVGQLGQILGPRGLMPNPKDGTVTTDIVTAINNAKKGQVRYRADKAGVIHCSIGKLAFHANDLIENLSAIVLALKKSKPATAKGVYFKKITLSTTMGPGLTVDISSLIS